MVGRPPAKARLAPPELRPPDGRRRRAGRRAADGSPLQRSTSPRTAQCCGGCRAELLLGQLERPLRVPACEVELPAVDGHDGDREMVLRHLQAVLDRDVVRAQACSAASSRRPARARPTRGPRARGRSAARPGRATRRARARAARGPRRARSALTIACVASWTSRSPPNALARSGRPPELRVRVRRRRGTSARPPGRRGRASRSTSSSKPLGELERAGRRGRRPT